AGGDAPARRGVHAVLPPIPHRPPRPGRGAGTAHRADEGPAGTVDHHGRRRGRARGRAGPAAPHRPPAQAPAGRLVGAPAAAPSQIVVELVAIGVLLFGSAANLIGGRALRFLIYIALTCEIIASAGIGVLLLGFHRINPFSVIFQAFGTGHGTGWLFGAFLLP